MINIKDLGKAIKQVAEEKSLEPAVIVDAIESAIAAAYKREYGERGEIVKAKLDLKTGAMQFWQVKTVVDETTVRMPEPGEEEAEISGEKTGEVRATKSEEKKTEAAAENEFSKENAETGPETEEEKLPRYNPDRHILIEDAKKIKSDAVVEEELTFPLETHEEFGRIAAQAAKQAVFQRLRESERDSILNEWRGKEGQIVSGAVQRFERGHVYIDLGRAVGVMFANESVPGEHYRTGERLRFLVVAVQEDTRLPGIILSRSHPKFVSKLFELEVPEVAEGAVEVKLIAREPGSRTKIAVVSNVQGVDPVGALVGQRGTRVMAVNNELGQEKIDIIEWADDPAAFIANSLSPAKAKSVEILPRREARVYVPEDQLSLAIGRGGQNVRLAAKLTGWKIDVRSDRKPEEQLEGGVAGAVESDEGMPSQFPEEKDSAAEE